MKRVSGLALASAALLCFPVCAAASDPAPTLATDAQGGTTLIGAHHLDGAAFSLIVTDWWLTGAVAGGAPQGVRLVVEVHLPRYPLLDHADDAAGRKLDVLILNRGPSVRWPKKASERVAVLLPRDYADKARTTGLSITVAGHDRSFPIVVPAEVLASFLDRYDEAVLRSVPQPVPVTPQSSAPAAEIVHVASPPPVVPPIPASAPPAQLPAMPKPAAVAPPATTPDDDDPAITPVQDKRVRLADGSFAPTAPPAAPPPPVATDIPSAPTPPLVSLPGSATFKRQSPDADDGASSSGGHGIWVDPLGLEFVPTSSGAMVLMVRPGSIAAAKGISGGDFIEAVDGTPIKAFDGPQMAAKIGAPGTRVLHMIAAGDVKIR